MRFRGEGTCISHMSRENKTVKSQGGNKVCFFIADLSFVKCAAFFDHFFRGVFVRKFVIVESKKVTNFRP